MQLKLKFDAEHGLGQLMIEMRSPGEKLRHPRERILENKKYVVILWLVPH